VEKAVALLQAEAGKHFDLALVTLFLDLLPGVLALRERWPD